MNRIRLANLEEIESLKQHTDLDESCMVLALTTQQGSPTAVVRTVVEVDPVVYPEGLHDRMKAMFQRDIETVLAAKGVKEYYFNVSVDNEDMLKVTETLGAFQISKTPELRFRVIL
jgi:hypothetical protein